MALTPEQIKAKHFVVGLRGYDKDEVNAFLKEAADALEEASQRTAAPAESTAGNGQAASDDKSDVAAKKQAERITADAEKQAQEVLAEAQAKADELLATAKKSAGSPGAPGTGADAFAQAGAQVAAVLRVAEEQAETLRAQGEKALAEAKREASAKANEAMAEADRYASDTKANADADAATRRSEADADRTAANRALSEAQDEALALVADAQKRADRMLAATQEKAQSKAEESLSVARAEYTRLRQQHLEASEKLQSAHDLLSRAVSSIGTVAEDPIPETIDIADPGAEAAADEVRGRSGASSATAGANRGGGKQLD